MTGAAPDALARQLGILRTTRPTARMLTRVPPRHKHTDAALGGSVPTGDPIRFALSLAGVARRQQACVPSTPVRVGLLLNGRARRLQASGARARLTALMPEPGAVVETPDLASVRRGVAELVCSQGANVLAVAGGDGTVHHAVNALAQLTHEAQHATGEMAPLPRLLILNGGTLNIVGRTVAIHGPPERTLRDFLAYFAGAPLSRVPARRLPLLEAGWLGQPPRLGFVFGSEVTFHALELYARYGAGYLGLSRFLAEFARGVLWGSELWQREQWKLGPYRDLQVDGQSVPQYTGVVASTVDLTLAIAAVRSIRRPLHRPGFAVRVVEETEPRRLVALMPALMREGPAPGLRDLPEAHELRLAGPYTLDGECFSEPALAAEQLPLRVTASDLRLYAVPGEWSATEW